MAPLSPLSSRRLKAFSLVEILVVCGAVLMMSAVSYPALRKANKQALQAKCASNWRNMGSALFMYAADNDGRLPKSEYTGASDQDVRIHLAPYLFPEAKNSAEKMAKTAKLVCPVEKWGYGFNALLSEASLAKYCDLGANTIYGIDLTANGRWLDLNVLGTKKGDLKEATPKPHAKQVGVLWLDGHVTFELVSKIVRAQVTRGSASYVVSDEAAFVGSKNFDL